MELVSTIEISGEEREIADAYARGQCTANAKVIDGINSNLDTLEYGDVAGGSNLFSANTNTCSENGVTAKRQNDGTFLLSGTSSTSTLLVVGKFIAKANVEYYMVGCPSGGGWSTYSLRLYKNIHQTETPQTNMGTKNKFTVTEDTEFLVIIYVNGNQNVSGKVFKPYISTKDNITYDNYEPYIPSVKMLAEEVNAQKNDLSDSLPVGTILTVKSDTPMSSDMWRFLNTGKMTYQNGGALVEMGTMIYQKIK